MPFVKLDTGLLDSTLWYDADALKVFITALLMAEPREYTEPEPTIKIRSLEYSDLVIPPGWYGFVAAAGVGIVRRALVDQEPGLAALERLASPEETSRSQEFDGRRLARVNGGYVVLNFQKYREKDHTAAERSARYRERKRTGADGHGRNAVTLRNHTVATRSATQAEAEAEVEVEVEKRNTPKAHRRVAPKSDGGDTFLAFWAEYPRKVGRGKALEAWAKLTVEEQQAATKAVPIFAECWKEAPEENRQYLAHATTWLNGKRWTDEPSEWVRQAYRDHPELISKKLTEIATAEDRRFMASLKARAADTEA